MHVNVVFHCATDYCVEVIIVDVNVCEIDHFTLKLFQSNSLGEMCFLEKNYKYMGKKWNFVKYESIHEIKSRGQPSTQNYNFLKVRNCYLETRNIICELFCSNSL